MVRRDRGGYKIFEKRGFGQVRPNAQTVYVCWGWECCLLKPNMKSGRGGTL